MTAYPCLPQEHQAGVVQTQNPPRDRNHRRLPTVSLISVSSDPKPREGTRTWAGTRWDEPLGSRQTQTREGTRTSPLRGQETARVVRVVRPKTPRGREPWCRDKWTCKVAGHVVRPKTRGGRTRFALTARTRRAAASSGRELLSVSASHPGSWGRQTQNPARGREPER